MRALICCDFSPAGKHVLCEAQKILKAFVTCEVHVYIVSDISQITSAAMYNNTEVAGTLEKEATTVAGWAKEIFEGKQIHFANDIGNPAEMILQKAAALPADLLIMGTHGKTGLDRLLVGSVAEAVIRHCNCNTLIVPVKHLKDGG